MIKIIDEKQSLKTQEPLITHTRTRPKGILGRLAVDRTPAAKPERKKSSISFRQVWKPIVVAIAIIFFIGLGTYTELQGMKNTPQGAVIPENPSIEITHDEGNNDYSFTLPESQTGLYTIPDDLLGVWADLINSPEALSKAVSNIANATGLGERVVRKALIESAQTGIIDLRS